MKLIPVNKVKENQNGFKLPSESISFPMEIKIKLGLNANVESSLHKLAYIEYTQIYDYLQNDEFDLAEKALAKRNILSSKELHNLIKTYYTDKK